MDDKLILIGVRRKMGTGENGVKENRRTLKGTQSDILFSDFGMAVFRQLCYYSNAQKKEQHGLGGRVFFPAKLTNLRS